jgi:hypothetical protein
VAKYYRTEIQKALRALAEDGPFYRVVYDATTKEPSVPDTTHVPPSSIEVNEVSSNFEESPNKRTRQIDRVSWIFNLMVAFDCEVLLEPFEQAIIETLPVVERDTNEGLLRQVELRLLQAGRYEHPIDSGETSGTQVVYTFEALLSRS